MFQSIKLRTLIAAVVTLAAVYCFCCPPFTHPCRLR